MPTSRWRRQSLLPAHLSPLPPLPRPPHHAHPPTRESAGSRRGRTLPPTLRPPRHPRGPRAAPAAHARKQGGGGRMSAPHVNEEQEEQGGDRGARWECLRTRAAAALAAARAVVAAPDETAPANTLQCSAVVQENEAGERYFEVRCSPLPPSLARAPPTDTAAAAGRPAAVAPTLCAAPPPSHTHTCCCRASSYETGSSARGGRRATHCCSLALPRTRTQPAW